MSHVYSEHCQPLMTFAATIIENECDNMTQPSSSTVQIQTKEGRFGSYSRRFLHLWTQQGQGQRTENRQQ